MEKTTGQIVSEAAVLTVLTTNKIVENRLSTEDRRAKRRELTAILNGQRGLDPKKFQLRTVERCAVGGAMISVNGVGIFGAN